MDNSYIVVTAFAGVIALVWLCVFAIQYRQSRDSYVRLWRVVWGAYLVRCVALLFTLRWEAGGALDWLARFALIVTAWAIVRSLRPNRERWLRRPDRILLIVGAAWSLLDEFFGAHGVYRPLVIGDVRIPYLPSTLGVVGLFAFATFGFYRLAKRRSSPAKEWTATALGLWAAMLLALQIMLIGTQLGYPAPATFMEWLHALAPVPGILLGISMLSVLFERERRAIQENLLAFAALDVDHTRLLTPPEVAPGITLMLDRLMRLVDIPRAAFCVTSSLRVVLPSVPVGLSPELADAIVEHGELADFLAELTWHRGGVVHYRDLEQHTWMAPEQGAHFELLRRAMHASGMTGMLIVGVYSRERRFGTVVFPLVRSGEIGDLQLKLLTSAGTQIGMTLENYVLMHDAQRRTKEYELLTQIGQVISGHLDPDAVMLAVQRELGQLFDTSNFYVAFQDGDTIRFELDMVAGQVQPKANRKVTNGITDYIIRTGQPLLIRSDMEKHRMRLGCVQTGRPAKCLAGVPIVMYGQSRGMMAVVHYEREFAFGARDLEVLQTAAGQVAVAMENARLFGEEQRRSRYLAFLNNISKTAISSQNADQMLSEIVAEIQKNFRFDHIGLGILDYATKEIEIKAEAGTTAAVLGRRVPLGASIVGRVARTNDMVLIQDGDQDAGGLLSNARSVLCVPITYGETLLGVLNVESHREHAFEQQEVLILRTLADLLATALHNAFIFQKLEQQAITDGLTGIKTRRFFLEAMQSEWKRAARSGRPFSVVLVDLDKFKEVNDSLGHLEGDLVLARVGRLLEQKCRQSNVVARYGGDEFVILMPETGLEQAQSLSERLRLWLATDPTLSERHVTGSFGVGSFPLHGATAEDIIRVADAGMYVAKHSGGNRVATVEEFAELGSSHRQIVTAFIEGFLQREHVGPEQCDELVEILVKLQASTNPESADDAACEAIVMLTRASETREMHAAGHGDAIAHYSEIIGRGLDLTREEMNDLSFAARVHDVGKILIPERLLNKHEHLSGEEYYLLKMHAALGSQICSAIPGGARIQQSVRHHHERFDGSGYPDKLKGEQIPLGARIIAVAEAYAHLTMESPYRRIMTTEEACRELEQLSGTDFDGLIVRMLVRELRGERAARQGL
jgi:diguanylate cyclase (GGDEF)-like protein